MLSSPTEFALHQRLGNDADHAAPRGQRGVGHLAHKACTATAVDELPTPLPDPRSGFARRLRKGEGIARP